MEYCSLLSSHSFLNNDDLSDAIIFFPTTPTDLRAFLGLSSSVLTAALLSSTTAHAWLLSPHCCCFVINQQFLYIDHCILNCAILGINCLSFWTDFNSKKIHYQIFLNPPLVGNLQSIFDLFGSLRYIEWLKKADLQWGGKGLLSQRGNKRHNGESRG